MERHGRKGRWQLSVETSVVLYTIHSLLLRSWLSRGSVHAGIEFNIGNRSELTLDSVTCCIAGLAHV